LYLSILIDRSLARPSFLASTEGGVDIEAVAAKTPEKILKEPVDPGGGRCNRIRPERLPMRSVSAATICRRR
jgi:succinyl-CoA synthetase beta subunit